MSDHTAPTKLPTVPWLLDASIADIRQEILSGATSCQALCRSYIDRIEHLDRPNGGLRAYITINSKLMDEARAVDEDVRAGRGLTRPLLGIPMAIKDNIDTATMPTTGGSVFLAGHQPKRDAHVVRRLRAAGAVLIGKTNLHELAMGGTTRSSLGGQTLNPYDTRRTPGGSSGGSGAAVAANLAAAALGTDTGQSVRSPSSANALAGLRGTRGLISRAGVMPRSITQDEVGPMARSSADLAVLLDVIAGYDPDDPVTARSVGQLPETYTAALRADAFSNTRVGVLVDLFGQADDCLEVNDIMRNTMNRMQALGAHIQSIRLPELRDVLTNGLNASPIEGEDSLDHYLNGIHLPDGTVPSYRLLAADARYDPSIHDSIMQNLSLDISERVNRLGAAYLQRARLRDMLFDAMARHEADVLFYPHQQTLVSFIGHSQQARNGLLSSGSGFPALTVHAGMGGRDTACPTGVPVGFELLARPWQEALLLALGHAYELARGARPLPSL